MSTGTQGSIRGGKDEGIMVCGGMGFVVGLLLYFGWKDSETNWKRLVARIAAVWMIISVLFYVGVYLSEL